MIVGNDFVHPRLLGIQHYHKPPLTYYITALGYKIFGLNEFGARFFLQLALLIQVLLTYKIGQVLFRDDKIAFSAAVIYFSFPIILMATNNLTTDAYLTTFILSGIYFWLLYKQRGKILGLYLTAIAVGLGFLTKGPVVFLPLLVFIISYRILNKKKTKVGIHHFLSVLVFLSISTPWFIANLTETPALWNYFFETHTIERALNAKDFNRDKPFWYFFAYTPLVGIPWFLFFLILLYRNRKDVLKNNLNLKLLLLNSGIILLLFSMFSSKLILYILPIFLFVALASAVFIQQASLKILKNFLLTYRILFLLLLLAVLGAVYLEKISMGPGMVSLLAVLVIIGVILPYSKLFRIPANQLLGISFLFSVILLMSFRFVANQNPYLINSTKSLAKEIKEIEEITGKNEVAVFDSRLSALPFYLQQKTINIHRSKFETKRETLFEKNKEFQNYYWDINNHRAQENLLSFLRDKRGVFLTKASKEFNDSIDDYLRGMNKKQADKWLIYY